MLSKNSLEKLTDAVCNKISNEINLYNQLQENSIDEDKIFEQYRDMLDQRIVDNVKATYIWITLKDKFPPIFAELKDSVKEKLVAEAKLKRVGSWELEKILLPEVERLTMDLDELDEEKLLVDQIFEKVYPMLIANKTIHFANEKPEPVFDLTDEEIIEEVIEDDFEPPYASSGNENSIEVNGYDEGDWD